MKCVCDKVFLLRCVASARLVLGSPMGKSHNHLVIMFALDSFIDVGAGFEHAQAICA